MKYIFVGLLQVLSLFNVANSAIAVRKFVHQKDISEHCRRRVVPSVFLGKHVVDANSQILHFSRLQLPYSCSISVRTEFGNNIILVIQLVSGQSLVSSCGAGHTQLQIYELGETFGGYWGPIPDVIMETKSRNYTQFYTLKTTPTTIKTSISEEESDDEEIEDKKEALSHSRTAGYRETEDDFIRVEVPLLNVSGDLKLNEISPHKKLDMDELFDLIYDVTPRNGGVYDTSILPLVQFAVRKQNDERRDGNLLEPKYELDYDMRQYTPDSRITYSTLYKKKSTKKYKVTKRLNFRRKHKGAFLVNPTFAPITVFRTDPASRSYTFTTKSKKNLLPTINHNILSIIYNDTSIYNSSWDFLDHLMESLNMSTREMITTRFLVKSNPSLSTKPIIIRPAVKTKLNNITSENNTSSELITEFTDVPKVMTSIATPGDISELNEDEVKVFFTTSNIDHETGSLVNHKSFENVVQAASVIAVLLNRSNAGQSNKNIMASSAVRKKRRIKALDIENARPRILTTRQSMSGTTENVYRYSDMQDLAQLVELQDDEIQGRVALRYLRKYVGAPLFNICDYNEPKPRQVYLFNSSRIVIAISNFTMERMTLVVTPARTLLSSVGRCPPAHLECQVAGTRVCIDSTNECDGVPNCGAYDIYDEDRLRCGWSSVLQHNVCLAACTFLAVTLTVLYTVFYWLKRCVPRVSEAFFIYTDTSENILYLDSVMRSPNDITDDYSKLFYQANFFDDDEEFMNEKKKASLCRRILKYILTHLQWEKKKVEKQYSDEGYGRDIDELSAVPRQLYSFTELELRNVAPIIKDATMQTGSSLECAKIENRTKVCQEHNEKLIPSNSKKYVESKQSTEINELNLLKLIRNLKLSPKCSDDSDDKEYVEVNDGLGGGVEEKELHNTLYEASCPTTERRKAAIIAGPQTKNLHIRKQLRFDEEVVIIPTNEEEDASSHSENTGSFRHLNTIREVQESGSTSGNEFMRFWRTNKKKPQKKSHQSSR